MADKKKRRIPKHIGGVKIPKELRRTGEALIDTVVERANSPAGREMLAGALSMAAVAATSAVAKARAKDAPPVPPVPPVPPAAGPYAGPTPQPPRDPAAPFAPEIERVVENVTSGISRFMAGFAGSFDKPRHH